MTIADREAYRDKIDRHRDAGTCHICGEVVVDGTPVHGLTGAHYECEVPDRVNPLDRSWFKPEPPPEPSGEYKEVVAKGGSIVHIIDTGTREAICGYKQADTAKRMKKRSGWYVYNRDEFRAPGFPRRFCAGCEAKFNKMQDDEL